MILVNFFTRKKPLTTANIAKERLQIIVAERKNQHKLIFHCLPELKHDLLQVIKKYIHEPKIISIQFKNADDNASILKCDVYISHKKK